MVRGRGIGHQGNAIRCSHHSTISRLPGRREGERESREGGKKESREWGLGEGGEEGREGPKQGWLRVPFKVT